jgi:hypothetical protein
MALKPVVRFANQQVPFLTAAWWAGLDAGERARGMKVTCPSCGERGALRVYADHGWCFSEQQYFSPVSLLAEVWEMDEEDAAVRALDKAGYASTGTELWVSVLQGAEPARDELATALRTWCAANCPDWTARQYDKAVAGRLAQCLGLLPRVQTERDCRRWLAVCKEVMGRALFQP